MQIFSYKIFTRRALVVIIAILTAIASNAQYSIYNLAGEVNVIHAGTQVRAEKGMKLTLPDYLELPDGNCWVQVLSERGNNKNIYRQDGPGTFSVSQILRNAEIASADNRKNLHENMRLASNHRNSPVFDETGMVTREKITADDVFAPLPDMMQMAQLIARAFTDTTFVAINNLPVDICLTANHLTAHDGATFDIEINVLSLHGSQVEVSPLGQTGTNIQLMPGQSIEKADATGTSALQVAFAAANGIDLATLADAIDSTLARTSPMVDIDPEIPVVIVISAQ